MVSTKRSGARSIGIAPEMQFVRHYNHIPHQGRIFAVGERAISLGEFLTSSIPASGPLAGPNALAPARNWGIQCIPLQQGPGEERSTPMEINGRSNPDYGKKHELRPPKVGGCIVVPLGKRFRKGLAMLTVWMTVCVLAAGPIDSPGARAASPTPQAPTPQAPTPAASTPAATAETPRGLEGKRSEPLKSNGEPFYESDADTDAALRSAYALKAQVREALRTEATSVKQSDEHLSATLELVTLYAALQTHEHLSQDEALRLKTQVRSRLLKIAADIERDLKREALAAAKSHMRSARGDLSVRSPAPGASDSYAGGASQAAAAPENVANSAALGAPGPTLSDGLGLPRQTLLFQIGAAMGQQPAGASELGDALIEVIKSATGQQKWEDQGGPGRIQLWRGGSLPRPWRQAGAQALAGAMGGRAVDDHGPELVELIETVIAPATWEKNGGFGSIVYFAPLRALLVRPPGERHRQLGHLLGNLRAAGN